MSEDHEAAEVLGQLAIVTPSPSQESRHDDNPEV